MYIFLNCLMINSFKLNKSQIRTEAVGGMTNADHVATPPPIPFITSLFSLLLLKSPPAGELIRKGRRQLVWEVKLRKGREVKGIRLT